MPGLATAWKVDATDKTRWLFTLRDGVKFHDGADSRPTRWCGISTSCSTTSRRNSIQAGGAGPLADSERRVLQALDDHTVEIRTSAPDAFLPYQLAWIMFSSPAQWEKLVATGSSSRRRRRAPAPWKLTSFVSQQRAEMVPNKDYWDMARVPKLDKLVLLPIPEAATRTAALRSGQVDWIEAPSLPATLAPR
ncbi:MAG: ABC transporter substrate-binding protein [Pseudomonadota bacterium]